MNATYLTGKHMHRRTLLRGLGGATLALPFLTAMAPAAHAQPALLKARRFVFVFIPNGYWKETWTPQTSGRGYDMPPALQPLAASREKFSVLTGLAADPSKTISGFHDRASCSVMTGVEKAKDEVRVAPSIDQIAAPYLSKDTALASLELGIEQGDSHYGPVFKTATNPLPMERNPRFVFERVFGDVDRLDPRALAENRAQQKSLLDLVLGSANDLKSTLGAADRVKLDQYLDSIREVEHKIETSERRPVPVITMERPAAAPTLYSDYVKLMFDLQIATLQADVTRVSTICLGAEASNLTYPEIGCNDSHHLTSHHGGQPAKTAAMSRINGLQTKLYDYMLNRMSSIEEADGTLLDSTISVMFSSLGNPDLHMQVDLPVLVAGGGTMGFKHGKHVKLPDNTPITNLYVSMLAAARIPIDRFGDSTGAIPELLEA